MPPFVQKYLNSMVENYTINNSEMKALFIFLGRISPKDIRFRQKKSKSK